MDGCPYFLILRSHARNLPVPDVAEGPGVSMIAVWDWDEGERTVRCGGAEEFFRGGGRSFVADELRSSVEAFEPCRGGCGVAVGVRPRLYAVVMAMRDEAGPQSCNVVVAQADVVARDSPPRENPARMTRSGSPP